MSQRITAVYEDGILRPLSPLELPEHSRVEIDIHNVASAADPTKHRDQVSHAMIAAGLVSARCSTSDQMSPLSPTRRSELAHIFAAGGPVSELINQEREGR